MGTNITPHAWLERIAKPLILGGPLYPFDPIGPSHAPSLAQQIASVASPTDISSMTVARVRHARHLYPVDTLPDISVEEWLMTIAIHDVLRATDPHLQSVFSPGRAVNILDGALAILAQVPAPKHTLEALARHATFASVFAMQRQDIAVSWWCGSRLYAGRKPPDRLLAWPEVRRVRSEILQQNLQSMMTGSETLKAHHADAWQALLVRTPLTDLMNVTRPLPPFRWTPTTVAMLSGPGRDIAMRALRWQSDPQTYSTCYASFVRLGDSAPAIVKTALEELFAWNNPANQRT